MQRLGPGELWSLVKPVHSGGRGGEGADLRLFRGIGAILVFLITALPTPSGILFY